MVAIQQLQTLLAAQEQAYPTLASSLDTFVATSSPATQKELLDEVVAIASDLVSEKSDDVSATMKDLEFDQETHKFYARSALSKRIAIGQLSDEERTAEKAKDPESHFFKLSCAASTVQEQADGVAAHVKVLEGRIAKGRDVLQQLLEIVAEAKRLSVLVGA